MSTNELLDQINNAIGDWEVSPDAMRCNPTPRIPAQAHRLDSIPRAVQVRVQTDTDSLTRAFEQIQVLMADGLAKLASAITAIQALNHRARPNRNGPTPLQIDGHAYRRRTRTRRSGR